MRNAQEREWVKVASRPLFNLYQSTMESSLYQVRLKSSGNYLRRRLTARNVEEALELAPVVVGISRPKEEAVLISLVDAFSMALKLTNRRERSRADWQKSVEKFLVWLRKHHPLCNHWGLMTRQIIREYLATFDGRAPNTKRLALQPLLQTARFMNLEYNFPNIGERLGIGTKLKTPPRIVYLEDVLSFCDFLRDRGSHLEVGACLQGLAGLQLLEALRLTWDCVDLKRGLIEVSGEVKNEYRNRVMPVMGRVLEALERAALRRAEFEANATGKVRELRLHVVTGHRGRGFEDPTSYGRQIHAALKAWNPKCDWAPKDLRNCLPTFAKMEGIHGSIWEQYIGHAPRTVTDRHYVPRLASRTVGEEKALDRQMDLFRKLVTVPLETSAKEMGESCKFLQISSDGN